MRSIFMGKEQYVEQVFDAESRTVISNWSDTDFNTITKEEILNKPEKHRDVELIFSTWNMPVFTKNEISELLPNLAAVFYAAGSVQYFARDFLETGVHVFSAWAVNAIPVAEYTVSHILLANKGFHVCARLCRSATGRQEARRRFLEKEGTYENSVGILGVGMVGKSVINLLKQHKVEVLVYDPFLSDEAAAALGAQKQSLEKIFLNVLLCPTILQIFLKRLVFFIRNCSSP